ncbi:Gryzun, putative trafficking through golgi-domain-containing protein [Cladochytrium replicatum]|nr:Gryzun, putative trafficking through golgi-domain-containing protein [Cladochytrium replicatum]
MAAARDSGGLESYPLEYILHHVPLMGVMGLLEPGSGGDPTNAAVVSTPPGTPSQTTSTAAGTTAKPRPTSYVKKTLLAALMAKNNRSIWDGGKGSHFFHVMPLEKSHTFPPKKLPNRPPGSPASPLSPLNPSSALYPDGIISPAWIKRHREALPSALVAFFELFEREPGERKPDSTGGVNLDKERDQILCMEINEKKRLTQDRGMKYAVVIILKQFPPDEQLDERLQFIKKTCGLEQKRSLFIIPSTMGKDGAGQVEDFVNNLQRALFEHAANYYREHAKRIRKKKSKIPVPAPTSSASSQPQGVRPPPAPPSAQQSSSTLGSPTQSSASLPPVPAGQQQGGVIPNAPRPLPPIGWHVRYEYKLAVFAEFRQDLDVSISHYEAAYQGLIEMFNAAIFAPPGSATALQGLIPYSARWEDARILADCINFKICKLYLYTDAPVPALAQFNRHILQFRNLPEFAGTASNSAVDVSVAGSLVSQVPRGGSFEYWAWASKQHRVIGEIVEVATTKLGLSVPYPPPGSVPPASGGAPPPLANQGDGGMFGPFSSSNSSLVVQHAGFYYITAARCAEERWRKFKLQQGSGDISTENGTATVRPSFQAIIAAEGSLDHSALVIELLTKSYEQFKKQKSGRMTLYLAAEIARIYQESGKQEMAYKFFERIAKTYRKESWPAILTAVVASSLICAKRLGMWDAVVESLVELLSERLVDDDGMRGRVQAQLMRIVANGASSASILTDDGSEIEQLARQLTLALTPPYPGAGDAARMPHAQSPIVDDAVTPSVPIRSVVAMDKINSFLTCNVQIRKENAYVMSDVPFQVTLTASSSRTPCVPIRASQIRVNFSDPRFNYVFVDSGGDAGVVGGGQIEYIDGRSGVAENLGSDGSESIVKRDVNLVFQPGSRKVLEGLLVPKESQDIKVLNVQVILVANGQIVEEASSVITLQYDVGERPEDLSSRRKWVVPNPSTGVPIVCMLDGFGEQTAVRVIRKQPNLKVVLQHTSPAFLDEFYPVTVVLRNEESEEIHAHVDVEVKSTVGGETIDAGSLIAADPAVLSNAIDRGDLASLPMRPSVSVIPTASQSDQATTLPPISISGSPPSTPSQFFNVITGVDLGPISSGEEVTRTFWMACMNNPGERAFHATVHYRVLSDTATAVTPTSPTYWHRKQETARIKFMRPFEGKFNFREAACLPFPESVDEAGLLSFDAGAFGMMKQLVASGGGTVAPLPPLRRTSVWLLDGSVKFVGPSDLDVREINVVHSTGEQGVLGTVTRIRGKEEADSQRQTFNCLYRLEVTTDIGKPFTEFSVGSMHITWRRKTADQEGSGMWRTSVLPIPSYPVSKEDVVIIADHPPEGTVGTLFAVHYTVQNTSLQVVELSVATEASEGFVFSGYKQATLRILPLATKSLSYNVLPLACGRCVLPRTRFSRKTLGTSSGTLSPATSAQSLAPGSPNRASVVGSPSPQQAVAPPAPPAVAPLPVLSLRGSVAGKDGELMLFVKPCLGW